MAGVDSRLPGGSLVLKMNSQDPCAAAAEQCYAPGSLDWTGLKALSDTSEKLLICNI